jgi:hemerythrin superfamily protein
MPDVTQLLTQDHRAVEQLFEHYEQSQDASTLEKICHELQIHTSVEEELVYPQLARIDRPLEEHSEDEHKQAKQLIGDILSAGCDSPQAQRMAMQLKSAVLEHVHEEEGKAFPEMRQKMNGQLDEMGERVKERKEQLERMS